MSRHANEASRDWHVARHLRHRVVDQTQHTGINCVSQEQTSRTAFDEPIGNGNERGRSNRSANCNQLHLTVAQVSLQLVDIVDMADLVCVLAREVLSLGRDIDLVVVFDVSHFGRELLVARRSLRTGRVLSEMCDRIDGSKSTVRGYAPLIMLAVNDLDSASYASVDLCPSSGVSLPRIDGCTKFGCACSADGWQPDLSDISPLPLQTHAMAQQLT